MDSTIFDDFFQCFTELEPSVPFVPFVKSSIMGKIWEVEGGGTDDKFC